VFISSALLAQLVSNLHYSTGGGLQVHNYWDSQTEVVEQLAALLREILAGSVRS
jgi:hypothetical protein